MTRIEKIKKLHALELEKHCTKNKISIKSITHLLDAEKTKKLLKRNAQIQLSIDKEIENSLEYEN